jgi:sugar phosphate isomerase/epimerase
MTGSWDAMLKQIAEAGYDGVETWLPDAAEENRFKELLEQYHLAVIIQIFTCEKPYPDSAEAHIASFAEQVERAATFRPVSINAHSAKDAMPYDELLKFFEQAIRIEKQFRIPIGHETHRGRATYTPWRTARLLQELPDLRLVADFSHWCTVCESLLPDQHENVMLACRHAIHIHGRVGYDQGPQVPDFRAPEFEEALLRHEQWWEEIVNHHRSIGSAFLTFTPEFGPAPYMHTLPYTQQPVVDLWEICLAMAQRFRMKYHQHGERL